NAMDEYAPETASATAATSGLQVETEYLVIFSLLIGYIREHLPRPQRVRRAAILTAERLACRSAATTGVGFPSPRLPRKRRVNIPGTEKFLLSEGQRRIPDMRAMSPIIFCI